MLFDYILPIVVAALVGGLIGVEREYHDKSAGFRTMILISVGSALFTMLSVAIGTVDGESTRIAAAVVSGVGFLGAGVIIKDGFSIRGLTTAAAIWIVSSLGMAAGAKEYELVLSVTLLALLVLWLLPPLEYWLDKLYEFSEFHITIKNTVQAEEKILGFLHQRGVRIVHIRRTRLAKGERTLHVKIKCSLAKYSELSSLLVASSSVITFEG